MSKGKEEIDGEQEYRLTGFSARLALDEHVPVPGRAGDYQVYVGASSRDVRLTGTLRVHHTQEK